MISVGLGSQPAAQATVPNPFGFWHTAESFSVPRAFDKLLYRQINIWLRKLALIQLYFISALPEGSLPRKNTLHLRHSTGYPSLPRAPCLSNLFHRKSVKINLGRPPVAHQFERLVSKKIWGSLSPPSPSPCWAMPPKKAVFGRGRLPLKCPCMEGLHFWSSTIVCSLNPVTAGHGSTNCGILASGMGGSGDSKRKWEEKFDQQGLKMVILH